MEEARQSTVRNGFYGYLKIIRETSKINLDVYVLGA